MSTKASTIVQKVWNYAHVLKDDGLAFIDYTEQITFLLFLKMAHERAALDLGSVIPKKFNWDALRRESGDPLEVQYSKTLRELGKLSGLLGIIFAKAQNTITDPAKLEIRPEDIVPRSHFHTLPQTILKCRCFLQNRFYESNHLDFRQCRNFDDRALLGRVFYRPES